MFRSDDPRASFPAARNRVSGRMRGTVLIVTISILVVLALLATVFASLSQIERNISRNYVDDVRARLLAESGVQEAISRLQQAMEFGEDTNRDGVLQWWEDQNGNGKLDVSWPEVTSWWYRGEDRNGNGLLDPGEDINRNGRLETLTCPLEDAQRPSFAIVDPGGTAGKARQIFIQEPTGARSTAVSGTLSVSSYGKNADQYLLKIVDTSSQIYLNDRNPNLARILNSLSINLGGPVDLGTRIVNARPPVGFTSKYDLLTRNVVAQVDFDRVKDFITAHAWVDTNVVNPVPLSATEHAQPYYLVKEGFGQYWRPTSVGTYRPGKKIYRYGPNWQLNPTITGTMTWGPRTAPGAPAAAADLRFAGPLATVYPPNATVYGVDELNPQWIEVTSRAPVNINTAPKEVLMALIEGLDGFYLAERNRLGRFDTAYTWTRQQDVPGYGARNIGANGGGALVATNSTQGSEIGLLYRTGPILGPAGTSSTGVKGTAGTKRQGLAEILARKIVDFRNGVNLLPGGTGGTPPVPPGPFTSWAQFNLFLDQLLLQDPEVYNNIFEGAAMTWPALYPEQAAAAQARIDVLKANFNPNLHLNEANPDEYLWNWVDKTDLVVASTEFCFTPMGIFEVESVGRVCRPIPDSADASAAGTNVELLAEKKVVTDIRLYGAVRETSQKQFFGTSWLNPNGSVRRATPDDSSFGPPTGATTLTATNYGYRVQSYPEPDNGDAPYDNEYEGYVALSTNGGAGLGIKQKHVVYSNLPFRSGTPSLRTTPRYPTIPGDVRSTANGTNPLLPPGVNSGGAQSPWKEFMRAHFDYDFNLRYSETQDTNYTTGGTPIGWYGERRVHFARRFERSQGSAGGSALPYWFNYSAPSETTNTNPGSITFPPSGRTPPAGDFRRHNVRGPYALADLCDGLIKNNYDRIAPVAQREYRVARSYRVQTNATPGASTSSYVPRVGDVYYPNLPFHYYAPSSLRADGGFIERYNAPCWSPTRAAGIVGGLTKAPVNIYQGAVSYWIKPNFFPEHAGKVRSFFSLASMRGNLQNPLAANQTGFMNPNPFTHYFIMAHNRTGVPTYTAEAGGPNFLAGQQRSFLFGYGFHDRSGYVLGTGASGLRPGTKPMVAGVMSRTLNNLNTRTGPLVPGMITREYAQPEVQRPFAGHKWVHVALVWRLNPPNPAAPFTPGSSCCEIYINGRSSQATRFWEGQGFPADPRLCHTCPGICWGANVADPWNNPSMTMQGHHSYHWFWDKIRRDGSQWNPQTPGSTRPADQPPEDYVQPVRLGEPTALTPQPISGNRFSRNFSPDSTLDEFWLFGDATAGTGHTQQLWSQGRYYRGNDGFFTSQSIDVAQPNTLRRLVPRFGATTGTSGPPPAQSLQEIVGVSWTILAKKYDSTRPISRTTPGMNRFIQYNYLNFANPNGSVIQTGVEMAISNNNGGSWYGRTGVMTAGNRLCDFCWSVPHDAAGSKLTLPLTSNKTQLKYRAYFRMGTGWSPGVILLETPVLDDITIFHSVGKPQILDWIVL